MRLLADDVLAIPGPPHLRGYELEDGELVGVSLPGPRHGRLVAAVSYRIQLHLESTDGAGRVYVESGCVLDLPRDPERLRGPDVSFMSDERLRRAGGEPDRGWFRVAPDLVIEIDSPGRRPSIEQRRIQDYLDAGVTLLWVIHTATRSATAYNRDGTARLVRESEALDGEPVLPGFRLPLADLFRSG
jgi:Uma2 family endonuclease